MSGDEKRFTAKILFNTRSTGAPRAPRKTEIQVLKTKTKHNSKSRAQAYLLLFKDLLGALGAPVERVLKRILAVKKVLP